MNVGHWADEKWKTKRIKWRGKPDFLAEKKKKNRKNSGELRGTLKSKPRKCSSKWKNNRSALLYESCLSRRTKSCMTKSRSTLVFMNLPSICSQSYFFAWCIFCLVLFCTLNYMKVNMIFAIEWKPKWLKKNLKKFRLDRERSCFGISSVLWAPVSLKTLFEESSPAPAREVRRTVEFAGNKSLV